MKHLLIFVVLTFSAFAQSANRPRIALIGDSTQTDNAGYGRGFCANLSADAECLNFARGGASTKTYRQLGLWDKAFAAHPDYMLIQFGHNDEVSADHNDREVPIPGYQENLRAFIREARAAHSTPVLITPLTRRYFGPDGKIHSDLTAYCDAMKEVAGELKVPLIDLQSRSIAYLDSIGETAGTKLGITKKDKDGKTIPDKTHLNWQGSYVFGRMVAEDLGKVEPELAKYVLQAPATLLAEGVLAMRVIAGEPFSIAVEGNSAVAAGFCKTVTPNVTCSAGGVNAQYYILVNSGDRKRVSDIRAAGAIPILVSVASPKASADSLRQLAEETHVTYVDLHAVSDKDPALIGRLLAENLIRVQVELGPNVVGLPDSARPAMPKQNAATDGH
jgi:lysophospholipase L1-like esterase